MKDFNFDDDDFQIKPITEGLGFHKKKIELQEDPMQRMQDLVSRPENLPKPKAQNHFQTKHYTVAPTPQPTRAPETPKAKAPARTQTHSAPKQTPLGWTPTMPQSEILEPKLIPVEAGLSAIVFDGAMVAGLVLIFSAVVFAVTGIMLDDLIILVQTEMTALFACLLLIFAVYEIYAVGCRSFFGSTLGEWAFDFQLGTKEQQQSFIYPVQVALRALLTCLTGFILLPIISIIIGRDIAGLLTGVEVYQEQYE